MEGVVLHKVGILGHFFCPKHGQGFKPSAAPLYSNMGQVPPGGSYQARYLSVSLGEGWKGDT